jgi:uncharacterized protein with PQ loop repeat
VLCHSHVIDLTSWRHVSQDGTSAQVLSFIKEQNIHKLSLDMIAWRMSEKDFYAQVHIHAYQCLPIILSNIVMEIGNCCLTRSICL